MRAASRELKRIVKESQAIIELVDARAPESSSNPMLKALTDDLPKITVLTKGDLANQDTTICWKKFIEETSKTRCLVSDYDNPINTRNLLKEINSISNRLKNKDFIAKAPKKVVEENKIKIEDMMQNKERLSSSKELIKKLIK